MQTLLEREAELAALSELLHSAGGGRGGLLIFEAAAGLGETSMLKCGARMARERGFRVLPARGHELERAFGWGLARSLFEVPLAGFSQPERAWLLGGSAAPAGAVLDTGELARPLRAGEAGFAIMHALYWLTVRLAESEPLLLMVDDAQWIDDPSLRFLLYLAGRLGDVPVAVLVATRRDERGSGGLVELVAGEPAARVHELAPLGSAAVGQLVRQRLDAVDEDFCRRCFDLTAGN